MCIRSWSSEQAETDRSPLLKLGGREKAVKAKDLSVIREEASAKGSERETPAVSRSTDLEGFVMDEVLTMREIAASSSATDGPSPPLPSTTNLPLLSAFLAFSVAQFLKIFTTWFKEKRWDSRRLLGSGGMPSSHSATVVALATAIGLQEGTAGSSFALAIVLASVVMYDASGIRLHAGRQAELTTSARQKLQPSKSLVGFAVCWRSPGAVGFLNSLLRMSSRTSIVSGCRCFQRASCAGMNLITCRSWTEENLFAGWEFSNLACCPGELKTEKQLLL